MVSNIPVGHTDVPHAGKKKDLSSLWADLTLAEQHSFGKHTDTLI